MMPTQTPTNHEQEVRAGQRFEFGKNWQRFLSLLNEQRIQQAETSLQTALRVQSLRGARVLDAGSGSGLFSLAARRLGAQVHSFDYDPQSVACTEELRSRFFPGSPEWVVEQGSVLDREYLASLGKFDIVYSWGVLHHTGAMWDALGNVSELVAPGGKLLVAIYNDQGVRSQRWKWVKHHYNNLPRPLRLPVLCGFFLGMNAKSMLTDLLRGKPFHSIRTYGKGRGMSLWRDLEDWVGGYPFEVAKPEELFEFYYQRGFSLIYMRTTNSLGCNEVVMQRVAFPTIQG